jgi:hypothetical protein
VLGESGGDGLAGFLSNAARAYAATAARYGADGSPYLPDPGAPGRAGAAKDAAARAGAAGSREREGLRASLDALGAAQPGAEVDAWTRRLATTIAVEQDAVGRVVAARVVERSGSDGHDRLALAQAARLVGELGAARLASTTTEWRFVTDFSVVPPVPALGVALDANFKPTGLVHPLKRTTRTEVTLVAVRRAG